jgi:PAS domain S-box-containing protein
MEKDEGKEKTKEQISVAMEALNASEIRYRNLFEMANEGVLILDAETGQILEANPFLVKLLGYSREELLGKELWDIGVFSDIAANKEAFAKLQSKKSIRYEDLPLETKDGRQIEVEFVSSVYLAGQEKFVQCHIRDITERKILEKLLFDSEEKYRRAFETSRDGLLLIEKKAGHIVNSNPAITELLGYSGKEFQGKTLKEVGVLEGINDFQKTIHELERTGFVHYDDVPVKTKSGQTFNTDIFMVDRAKVIQCNVRDITERKNAEETLKTSEIRYRRLFEAAKDGILILDWETGQIADVNPFIIEMLGFSHEELLGKKLWEIGIFKDVAASKTAFEELKNKGRIRYEDLPLETKSGRRISVEFVSNVYEVDHTKVVQCNIRDITERKLVEEALKSSEEKYRNLVERASDGIVIIQDGIIGYANPRIMEMWGGGTDEIIGNSFMDYAHPDELPKLAEMYKRRMAGEKVPQIYETVLMRKDGSNIYVELNGGLTAYGGKPADMVIVRNISDRKRIQEAEAQLIALKQLAEMENRFMVVATHELRTPLVSMKGYTDIILSGKAGDVPPKIKEMLSIADRNVDRLIRMTANILDAQRIKSGKLQVENAPVDVSLVLQECLNEIRPVMDDMEQSIEVEIPSGPLMISGDFSRLSQVIMNILSNASKFTPKKGKIRVKADEEENFVRVSVKDTGIGIRKKDIERVFEIFADIEKPDYFKGTGLGMSVSKGIVEAHGGTMYAYSEGEGKGSTFTVVLPKSKGAK